MAEVAPLNQARSTLAAAVTSSGQTSLQLQSADNTKFNPSGTYRVILWQNAAIGPWEICTVTGGQGTATLTVTRASEPVHGVQTAYSSWPIGTNITAILTKGGVDALLAAAGGGGSGPATDPVYNATGSTIPAHTAVTQIFAGPVGGSDSVGVKPLEWDRALPFFGVTLGSIAPAGSGTIQRDGLLVGLDTSSFGSLGNIAGVDGSGALVDYGSVTTGHFLHAIGYCTKIDAVDGHILLVVGRESDQVAYCVLIIDLWKNGSLSQSALRLSPFDARYEQIFSAISILNLAAGDYIEVNVFQQQVGRTLGSDLFVSSGAAYTAVEFIRRDRFDALYGVRATMDPSTPGDLDVPPNTNTQIPFNVMDWDTSSGAIHSNTVNPTRFTVPAGQGGYWEVHLRLDIYGNG